VMMMMMTTTTTTQGPVSTKNGMIAIYKCSEDCRPSITAPTPPPKGCSEENIYVIDACRIFALKNKRHSNPVESRLSDMSYHWGATLHLPVFILRQSYFIKHPLSVQRNEWLLTTLKCLHFNCVLSLMWDLYVFSCFSAVS
jgi:hypothetical protein